MNNLPMMQQILVIEDDVMLNRLLVDQLGRHGYSVKGVTTWRAADDFLRASEPALILTDARLPDGNSLERLPELVEIYPVILLTAYGSVKHAVEAMRNGAADYLVKPVSPDELLLTVDRTLANTALKHDHQFCKRQLKAKERQPSLLVGNSPALAELQSVIEAVAPDDITVLIQGESGSGKELVARTIHDLSERAKRNFVAVDCCTLQEKLFESELFGHERGAFTGADRQKKGLIEGAEGGTLFLDEIGEIEMAMQAKLLRILETGTFRRLGGTKDLNANVRVVAATNRDLAAMIDTGEFRADLFYRLNGFNLVVPPLRDRREDISALVEHFLRNHNFSRRIEKEATPSTIRKLVAYDWPGNIRELKNVVERAIILSRNKPQIRPEHLAFGSGLNRQAVVNLSFDHDPTLAELERHYLDFQLKKHSGVRAKVAEVMDVSERNVYRLLKRYDLQA